VSNLSDFYRKYDREFFIATLNDWQWFEIKTNVPPGIQGNLGLSSQADARKY